MAYMNLARGETMQPAMGAGGTAPVTAPTAPPAGTYYAPAPQQAQASEDYATAQDAYNKALIRFNQQRGDVLHQYGYAGDVDPNTGLVKNVHVDAGNSFGQLQQLLHTAALDDQSAVNSAEDRGLVGGLAHQGESELQYQHKGQLGNLANSLFGNLSGIDAQQYDAKSTLDQALWELQHSAVQDAITNSDYNPATPPDTSGGGGGTNPRAHSVASHIGSIPTSVANKLVRQAIAHGQPVSEHGLGQMKSPTRRKSNAAKKSPMPNAYTSGRKKRG